MKNNNYQFYHDTQQEYTAVIHEVEKEQLNTFVNFNLINNKTALLVDIGLSKKHPDDQYCRKTGREVALSHIAQVEYNLHTIIFKDNGTKLFKLYSKDPFYSEIFLETKDERPSVYFVAFNY